MGRKGNSLTGSTLIPQVILSHVSPCCEADFCAIVRAMEILQQVLC